MAEHYDVVIVGAGICGSIPCPPSRRAGMTVLVLVLEAGRDVDEASIEAVAALVRRDYVDDARYARTFAEDRARAMRSAPQSSSSARRHRLPRRVAAAACSLGRGDAVSAPAAGVTVTSRG